MLQNPLLRQAAKRYLQCWSQSAFVEETEKADSRKSGSKIKFIIIMAISDVQQKGNYYQVFDDSGKKISELWNPHNEFELLGVASDFFVVKEGNYFKTFDEKSKKIAELWNPHDKMTFKSAAGSSFTVKEGSYFKTYDKNCKKTGERWNP